MLWRSWKGRLTEHGVVPSTCLRPDHLLRALTVHRRRQADPGFSNQKRSLLRSGGSRCSSIESANDSNCARPHSLVVPGTNRVYRGRTWGIAPG